MNLYIKVGSITNAQRGQMILSRYGIKCGINRLESPSKSDGCGYMLVTNDEYAISLLKSNRIRVYGVDRD